MKRSTTILGRVGTVLIAISLALILVSLIPQINLGTSAGMMTVAPEQVYTTRSRVLTPQQGFRVKVTVEDSINIYLLEVGSEYPIPGESMLFDDATELQEFLDSKPDLVIWKHKLENGCFDKYFTPTKVMNATLVFYNPSSDQVTVDYEATLTITVAPGQKVLNIALWTTPIGIILALPWLVNRWKQRKQS